MLEMRPCPALSVVVRGTVDALAALSTMLGHADEPFLLVGVPGPREEDGYTPTFSVARAHRLFGERLPGAVDANVASLTVGEAAHWLVLPDGTTVNLRRRRSLRRILMCLVQESLRAPGRGLSLEDLVAGGWPDEKILPDAARNRVYVAMSRLRKLGVRWVVSTEDGWFLEPTLRIIAPWLTTLDPQ